MIVVELPWLCMLLPSSNAAQILNFCSVLLSGSLGLVARNRRRGSSCQPVHVP